MSDPKAYQPSAPDEFDPQLEALRVLAERKLCHDHLLPYIVKANPGYQPGWVHKEICAKLEEFEAKIRFANKHKLPGPRLMLQMPPRHGKLVAHDEAVLTPTGWRTHGELQPGDFVFHPSGRPVKVLACSEEMDANARVHFSNGESIICHENHEWTVYDRPRKKYRTIETNWFTSVTRHGKQRQLLSADRCLYQLPNIAAVEYSEKSLPIDPYWFGLWLGDGQSTNPQIICEDCDLDWLNHVPYTPSAQWRHKDNTNVVHVSFGGHGLRKKLRQMDVFTNKHIPEIYLRSSKEQRLALLAGLIDSDGHVDKKSRVRISTARKVLAEGIEDLLTGLGLRPYTQVTEPQLSSSGVQGKHPIHCIGFQPTFYEIPTRLPRKKIHRVIKQRRIGITHVEYSDFGKGKCIQVDSPDGLYLVGRKLIPTHNSEIASRSLPAWYLGRNPDHEVVACSYASSLALKFSRKARALFTSEMHSSVFPEAELDTDSRSAENWLTTQGGGYMAAGVSGPITGNGFHLGIIDDPVKNREEAESETIRASIKDWYTSTFLTRQAPGAGILVILTRWHDDDLAGWLLREMSEGSGEEWEVIKYPAIATEDEKYRKKGEPLHADRYPLPILETIKNAVGNRDWESLYQQNPTADDGDYFTKGMFKYYRDAELLPRERMTFYQAWDFAIGKKEENDWTVGICVGVDDMGRIWIVDLMRGKWDAYEIVEKILDFFQEWQPMHVGLEKGQIAMALGPHLQRRIEERGAYEFPYDEQHMLKTGRNDKQARARSIQGRMRAGKVLFPEQAPWSQELVNEMLRFPNGLHDDQVDALAWIGIMLNLFVAPNVPKEDHTPKWLKKHFKRLRLGTSASAMGA